MPKPDPLAAALDAISAPTGGGVQGRIVQLFSDRPEVLDAIARARRERKLSYAQIARALSRDGNTVGPAAVQTWLDRQGIE